MKNNTLNKAKKLKKDEFYTLYEDIEKEIFYYEKQLENKIIYCNCDNPRESNFVKFFINNFERLKLKKLIATCYQKNEANLFNNEIKKGLLLEYSGEKIKDISELEVKELNGDGDFRSLECVELLTQADVIITNPPFSLFREFIDLLYKHNKKFLIIGNLVALTYIIVCQKFKEKKIWLGASIHSGDVEFKVPNSYNIETKNYRFDSEGNKYVRVRGIRWFTNLKLNKNNKNLKLNTMEYNLKYNNKIKNNPFVYKKYDNYEAIEVPSYTAIPSDYNGIMGVPISFLDYYNPEQFEIISFVQEQPDFLKNKEWNKNFDRPYIKGKRLYFRVFIRFTEV